MQMNADTISEFIRKNAHRHRMTWTCREQSYVSNYSRGDTLSIHSRSTATAAKVTCWDGWASAWPVISYNIAGHPGPFYSTLGHDPTSTKKTSVCWVICVSVRWYGGCLIDNCGLWPCHGLSGTQVASTLLATVGQLLLHAAALQENVSQLQVLGIMINKFASWAARENGQDSQSPSLQRVNREAQLMILGEVTYVYNYRRCFTVCFCEYGEISKDI